MKYKDKNDSIRKVSLIDELLPCIVIKRVTERVPIALETSKTSVRPLRAVTRYNPTVFIKGISGQ